MRKARAGKSNKKKVIVIFILVLVLAIIAAFFGYQAKLFRDQKRYRRHMVNAYQKGDYAISLEYQKDIDRTKNLFSSLLEDDVNYYEADCYMRQEKYDKAIAIYDQMLDKKADDSKLYMLKGNCYMKKKQTKEALETYKTGYEVTKDTSLLPNIAYCHIKRGNYEKAKEIVKIGLDSGDESIKQDLLFDEIVLYEKEMDYKKAYEKAKEYVNLYPDDEKGQKELTFLETR
ncbi:MAG: tetratricopeptide repeat protein [Lachnospiraceae bacterium]